MSNAALFDAPWDFTRGGETHRFPAATYLRKDVATKELTHAERALVAVNAAASARIGLAGGLTLGLVIAVAAVALGNDDLTRAVILKVAVLGTILVVAILALATMVRRHDSIASALAARMSHYETRLSQLDPSRRRERG